MTHSPFIDGFHEPELMRLMTQAYSRARLALPCADALVADAARTQMALNILCAVAMGERDVERLAQAAIKRSASDTNW
jgi:hypothetical protein